MAIASIKDSFTEQVEHFFKEPGDIVNRPVSNLYKIRCDIRLCLKDYKEVGEEGTALYPALLAIVGGIDLLAKFYCGNDYPNKTRIRFKTFTERYFPISFFGQEVLYQLRNSLIFSLNLSSRISQGALLRYCINNEIPALYEKKEGFCLINIELLNQYFEDAIHQYYEDLKENSLYKARFKVMYNNYGLHLS